MIHERLVHDVAFMTTEHLIEFLEVPNCMKGAVFGALYERIKAAIECYCIQLEKVQQRLKPSRN